MSTNSIEAKQRPARVLLIEDNPGDVILTKRAFRDGKIANELTVATTGEQGLDILLKRGEFKDTVIETPDLILLDLNLPMMHGKDVLKEIKTHESLKHIPIIILSSSQAEQDVVQSYNLHANGYVVKPVSMESFNDVVQKLEQFWFTLVVLPDAEDVAQLSKESS